MNAAPDGWANALVVLSFALPWILMLLVIPLVTSALVTWAAHRWMPGSRWRLVLAAIAGGGLGLVIGPTVFSWLLRLLELVIRG